MTSSARLLHESVYYRVEQLAFISVVKVTRLARPFTSQNDVDLACDPVQAALDTAGRRTHLLLIDTRQAIGKNDAAYEKWFEAHRRRMLLGFARVAFIVQTAVGKMHVERLLAAEKLEKTPKVFLDEALALRDLAGG